MKKIGKWLIPAFSLCCNLAFAQTYPSDFNQTLVVNTLSNPTVMAFAPDGRIFVGEQGGKLRVVKNNALLTDPFVSLVVNSSGERGLIGVALDPDFSNNNFVYIYHTVPGSPVRNRITRFTADGDIAQPGSEVVILNLDPLSSATNHNGGAMHFGPDGKLYVAVGDNANGGNAQNLDTYHGKLLRINSDGSVPDGNPFTTGTDQQRRVWAYGLRNPYTFSIQPGTGKIFVNDVGQNTWEEINDATTGGLNFGWPQAEGNSTNPAYTNPVYAYQHGAGDGRGCAITGGVFFNPDATNYPGEYFGKYFFQDLCNNWINNLDLSGPAAVRSPFATSISGNGLSLSVGNDGNLYYLSRSASALFKIAYNNSLVPFVTNHPVGITVAEGQPANFSVSAVGTLPLTYQWRKDGQEIDGATSSSYSIPNTLPENEGSYDVVVTNVAGSTASNPAILTVTDNKIPLAEILTPETGTTYVAGTSIDFSGEGTDPEDGILPASSFSWGINFHHDDHKHDQPAINDVKNGMFDIPDEGETSSNVWYRIILTVTDSKGLTGKDSVDIHPRLSTISFKTVPVGLQVTLDGQPFDTPGEVSGVEGMKRTIGIISPQVLDDVTYAFDNWQHGGDEMQAIVTPEDDIEFTANFSAVVSTAETQIPRGRNLLIYPNPVSGEYLMIKVQAQRPMNLSIMLRDILSREVINSRKRLETGENEVSVPIENIPEGLYSVIVEYNKQFFVKKVLIKK